MRIAICDDSRTFAKAFKNSVDRICDAMEIDVRTDVFYNGYDIVENCTHYQLIFLDIDMPKITGIEVCRLINERKKLNDMPYIVFVTCKDNLVFDALKQYPYSFIRKSSLDEELRKCIRSIDVKISKDSMFLSIKEGRSTALINLNDVLYIEKVKNYMFYHTESDTYKERGNMDEKEKQLRDRGFMRCHSGYLVNAKRILSVDSSKVMFDNEVEVPISRKYKQNIKNKYYEWMVERYA